MELKSDWKKIKAHFNKSFSTNFHVSIASIDLNNNPTNTPIGSLFLNNNQTGFYFEKYTTKLPKNVNENPQICILAVNSGTFFWIKSLFLGRFSSYPALKLYGTLGEKRIATKVENKRLQNRMKNTKKLKGHKYLWDNMQYVREITFSKVEQIKLGEMTNHLL